MLGEPAENRSRGGQTESVIFDSTVQSKLITKWYSIAKRHEVVTRRRTVSAMLHVTTPVAKELPVTWSSRLEFCTSLCCADGLLACCTCLGVDDRASSALALSVASGLLLGSTHALLNSPLRPLYYTTTDPNQALRVVEFDRTAPNVKDGFVVCSAPDSSTQQ